MGDWTLRPDGSLVPLPVKVCTTLPAKVCIALPAVVEIFLNMPGVTFRIALTLRFTVIARRKFLTLVTVTARLRFDVVALV